MTARRLVIDVALTLTSPLAAGGGEWSPATGRPAQRDDDGRPTFGSAGFVGALRSRAERLAPSLLIHGLAGEEVVTLLFGTALEHDDNGAGSGSPSRLRASHCVPGAEARTEIRDGVGIDRATGAARRGVKFDVEAAEVGTHFALRLELDMSGREARAEAAAILLDLALDDLARNGAVGGRTGSGLGTLTLSTQRRVVRLDDEGTLRHWLRARPTPGPPALAPSRYEGLIASKRHPADVAGLLRSGQLVVHPEPVVGTAPGSLRVTLGLVAQAPLLIGGTSPVPEVVDHHAAVDPSQSDAQPVTRLAHGAGSEFVAPGSGTRGALRWRGERIVRHLGGAAAACDLFDDDARSPTLACGRRKLPHDFEERFALENAAPAERRPQEADRAEALRREHSCPVCRLFGSGHVGGRVRVGERKITSSGRETVDHVAIDRFTGGSSPSKKFDSAPLLGARLDVVVDVDHPTPADAALVLLVLRDLYEGLVPLGSRTTRGYGAVAGTEVSVDVEVISDANPLAAWCGERSGLWHRGRHMSQGPHFLVRGGRGTGSATPPACSLRAWRS